MNTNRITNIIGSKRFKKATNQNTNIQIGFEESVRPIIEDNVIDIVSQYQVFLEEREKIKKYRFNGRFNIYTTNAISSASTAYINGRYSDEVWNPLFYGLPQPLAPSNWVMQITYPSDSLYNYPINARTNSGNIVSEAYRGLQYQYLSTTLINNNSYLTVVGVQNHNLVEGEYVYIYSNNFYNSLQGVYSVRSVGIDGSNLKTNLTLDVIVDPNTVPFGPGNFIKIVQPSSDDINFTNPGSILFVTATDITGSTIGTYTLNESKYVKVKTSQPHKLLTNNFVEIMVGSASALNGVWKVYNIVSTTEFIVKIDLYVNKGTVITPTPLPKYRYFDGTPSEYYVRLFEVLTTNDYEVYPCAFSSSIYPDTKDYTIGTANNTWLFHFNKDVNLERIKTNRNAEISDLFYTTIKRAGQNPFLWSNVNADWDFNYETTNTANGLEFVSIYNTNSIGSIEKISGRTEYIDSNGNIVTVSGSKYIGDFVEFNAKEILEKTVADVINRFAPTVPNPNGRGYYYKPFKKLEIRKYSTVIETADSDKDIENLPADYVTYPDNTIAWRDLLTVGYFEDNQNGIEYPFINNTHYYYFNHNLYVRLQPDPNAGPITRTARYVETSTIPQKC